MGKYILEVVVLLLLAVFLAPIIMTGVSKMRRKYSKTVDEIFNEEDK